MKNIFFLLLFFISQNSVFSQNGEIQEVSKSASSNLVYADFNNDGNIDIASLTLYELGIYLGDGQNNFGMKISVGDSLNTFVNFQVGDYDQNNQLDISIISDSKLLIFYNNNLDFQRVEVESFPAGAVYTVLMQIDTDSDGKLDLISNFINYPNGLQYPNYYNYINRNLGQGNFQAKQTIFQAHIPSKFKVDDLDNDGDSDAVFISVQENSYDRIGNIRNQSGNMYASNAIIGHYPYDFENFELIDVDLDGIKDVVVANTNQNQAISWYKTTLIGDYFHLSTPISITVPTRQNGTLHLQDVDGDGLNDLILKGTNKISWYKITSSGVITFQGDLLLNLSSPTFFDTKDINNDGKFDIQVFQNSQINHYLNDGSNGFPLKTKITYLPNTINNLKLADLDGDGLKDMVYQARSARDLVWQKNLGNNNFGVEQIILRDNADLYEYEMADIDNDNDIDLILSGIFYLNNITYTNKLIVYKNNNNGTFTDFIVVDDFMSTEISIKDVNNDGYVDVSSISRRSSAGITTVNLYKNNSGTSFSEINLKSDNHTITNLNMEDLNNDGQIDISIVDLIAPIYVGGVKVFYNQGINFTSEQQILSKPRQFYQNHQGDFDNDNDIDIITINTFYHDVDNSDSTSSYFMLYKNDGLGNFTDSTLIDTNFRQRYFSNGRRNLNVIDFDFDGDLDFFHLVYSDFYYFENLGNGVFDQRKQCLPSFERITNLAISDVNSDSQNEIFLPSETLGRIVSFKMVESGSNPDLLLSSSSICAGTNFQINVGQTASLNDNLAWALYDNSLLLNPIQINSSGVFNLTLYQSGRFYVRAIGGISYFGELDSIDVNLTPFEALPQLSSENVNDTTIKFTWVSQAQNLTDFWEYSIDNGASWSSLNASTDSVQFTSLDPNLCINFLLREVFSANVCANSEAVNLVNCSPCESENYFDTVYVCDGKMHTFHDGVVSFNVSAQVQHTSVFQNRFQCDSTITTTLRPYEFISTYVYDTICQAASYTFPDGYTKTDIYGNFDYYIADTASNGCDSSIYYRIYAMPPNSMHIYDEICAGLSYTFPDNVTFNNIQNSFLYPITFQNGFSCDSLVTYHIFVPSSVFKNDTITVCSNREFIFDDGFVVANTSSSFVHTYTIDFEGTCDTTYNMYLRVVNANYNYIEDTICFGENYNFGSQVLTETGNYFETYLGSNSCDSIVELQLFVVPIYNLALGSLILDSSCVEALNSIQLTGPTYGNLVSSGPISNDFGHVTFPFSIDSLEVGTYNFVFQDLTRNCYSSELTVDIEDVNHLQIEFSPLMPICDTLTNFILDQASPFGGVYSINGIEMDTMNPSLLPIGINVLSYYYFDAASSCEASAEINFDIISCEILSISETTVLENQLFPNPTKGVINFSNPNTIKEIKIIDELGRVIYAGEMESSLDISSCSAGLYTIFMYSENSTHMEKVVLIK